FVYSMIIVFQTFTGPKEKEIPNRINEPSVGMLISPIILSSLVIIIFIFPNTLANFILKPAVMSIYPAIELSSIGSIHLWNGVNRELLMTIGIISFGSLLYLFKKKFKKVYIVFPLQLSLDRLYNRTLFYSDRFSKTITNSYMTGY